MTVRAPAATFASASTDDAATSDRDAQAPIDDAPRVVTVPLELAEALAGSPAAAAAYEALSYSHRREYAAWVDGAKREPTRRERAAKTLARLLDGLAPP